MPCTFCEHRHDLAAVGALLYDDADCAVLLHDDDAVAGHAMVVWKRHVENIADLAADEAAHFIDVHRRAEQALLTAVNAERAILLKLGLQTPHLHLHIYPVSAAADRAEVFAAIDGRVRAKIEDRDSLIRAVREALVPRA